MTKKAAKLIKKTTRKKPQFDPDRATTDQANRYYKNDLEFAQWVFNRFFNRYASLGGEYDKEDARRILLHMAYSLEYSFEDEGI